MKNEMPSSYPHGEAGPDTESGPVNAAAPEGSDYEDRVSANTSDEEVLSAGSSAKGSPTSGAGVSEAAVDATVSGKPVTRSDTPHPEALIEGNRVVTAKDME